MSTRRGFTLLEVMVAIAILGLALTVILSAQAGLYTSGASAQKMSIAIGLARCRMSEIEEKLLKFGYPETDEEDEGACCEDDDRQDIRCHWHIEKVELPPIQSSDLLTGSDESPSPASSALEKLGGLATAAKGMGGLGGAAGAAGAAAGLGGGMGGALGTLLQLSSSPDSFAGDGGVDQLATDLAEGSGASGPGGVAAALAPLMMGFVYPQLKPMLETSIRKVTVKIEWKEGLRSRDFSIVQYVTRPMLPPPILPGAANSAGTTAGAAGAGVPGGASGSGPGGLLQGLGGIGGLFR